MFRGAWRATGTRPAEAHGFHLPSLDGIRACAFMTVFLAHAGLEWVVPGGFGVTVFFFLSGYLITTLLRIEFERTGTVSLRQFYLRRALRILPPFYLVLSLAVVASRWGALPGELQRGAVAAQSVQLANYWIAFRGYAGLPAGTGVYWSLAVEEHFYLLFPLIFILARRRAFSGRTQATLLWAACAAVLLWRCVLVLGGHASADRVGLATDTRVDSILFGCAMAVYKNPACDERGPIDGARGAWAGERRLKYVWLPASLALLAFTFLERDPVFRETLRYTLQGIALYAPMAVVLRFSSWGPARLLNGRTISFMGVLSYSLYLVHHVVLYAVRLRLDASPIVQGALALFLSIAFAWASYLAIEKPCAAWRRRLSQPARLSRRPPPAIEQPATT